MATKEISFNGRKYRPVLMKGGWRNRATTDPRTYLARDIWQYFTGEVLNSRDIIHHLNRDTLDDRMN